MFFLPSCILGNCLLCINSVECVRMIRRHDNKKTPLKNLGAIWWPQTLTKHNSNFDVSCGPSYVTSFLYSSILCFMGLFQDIVMWPRSCIFSKVIFYNSRAIFNCSFLQNDTIISNMLLSLIHEIILSHRIMSMQLLKPLWKSKFITLYQL